MNIGLESGVFYTKDGEIARIGRIETIGIDISDMPDVCSLPTFEGEMSFRQTKLSKKFLRRIGLVKPKPIRYSKSARKWK